MSAVAEARGGIAGGSFLTEERTPDEVSTPEDFSKAHHMIAETTRAFVDSEVRPATEELERHDWELARRLIHRAAELDLVGINVPEEYGGLGLDQTSGAIVAEMLGRATSFAATLGVQTGLGLTPIIYFGTEAAKKKYLPRVASGELVTAYALTEAGSGSDALAAKTTARLSEDGAHYVIKGEKMWITNGGFADLFVVFAKVDGDKFTGFIVERQPGLASGAEERKMGIRGSSTTTLVLSDVKTPVENLLGEVGRGASIASGILNLGRLKLGAMCLGGMKLMTTEAVRYANERHQFGKPISSFGAIRAKLAEMAIRSWVGEALVYRTVGLVESALHATADPSDPESKLRAIEEYAAECSAVKVSLSEYCNFAADEMVQVFGGYGYSKEYPAERAYRDARINRIFEGTNEINRMLIIARIIKGALAAQKSAGGLLSSAPDPHDGVEGALALEAQLARACKRVALATLGAAVRKYKAATGAQQETLTLIADIITDTYAMESAVLRARKLVAAQGEERSARHLDVARVFCRDALARVETSARTALAAACEGEELRALLAAVRRLTRQTPINTVAARQRVADALVEANKYAL